jgi:hypothetical protein
MGLATPEKIQTLQRKLYLKAKRESTYVVGSCTSTRWGVAGNVDTPLDTCTRLSVSSTPRVCFVLVHAFGMNLVREPDAGDPHVRFDERVGETEYGRWD